MKIKTIPCFVLVVFLVLPTALKAPQYTLSMKQWKTGVIPPKDVFTFIPPEDARILDPNALIDLDELPRGASEGGTK